jgi:hypothetical protein
MSTTFFTNKDTNSLVNMFEEVYKNQNVNYFDALIGCFSIRLLYFFREKTYLNYEQVAFN